MAFLFAGNVMAQTTPTNGYLGADGVLRQAASSSGQTKSKDLKDTRTEKLRQALTAFRQQSVSLPPAEAAKQWLALVDRYLQLNEAAFDFEMRGGGFHPLEPLELVEALPSPESWGELAKAIEARPAGEGTHALSELGLRLLAHTLQGNAGKRREDIAGLESLAARAKTLQAYFFNSLFDELSRSVMAAMDNPEAVLRALDRKLAMLQSEENSHYQPGLDIPDLVSLVGQEKAEVFLQRALVKSKAQLEVASGTPTDKLARKLALELVNELKVPQWSLVSSLDAVDLYEAMEKRFARSETNEPPPVVSDIPLVRLPFNAFGGYERRNARIYYLLGLIARERTTHAVAVAREFEKEDDAYFPNEVIRQMERAGLATQLNSFFRELLRQNPDLPFWEEYVQVAAHAGQTAEMVKLVQTTVSKPGLSKSRRRHLQELSYEALLANDDVEAGIAQMRGLLQTNEPPSTSSRRYRRENRGQIALKLARVGHLLNRPDWLEEGIAAAKAAIQGEEEASYSPW